MTWIFRGWHSCEPPRTPVSLSALGITIHAQSRNRHLVVFVHDGDGPISEAEVQAGPTTGTTGADGRVTLTVPAGRIDVITITRRLRSGAAPIDIAPGVKSTNGHRTTAPV